ncbi:ribosome silencing factor [Aliikangiella sp. IMCC44359]|uniref:ribosome silencing factor n=1 Tax=Aliikangiella sp. IMCC44359 TaxID=3459125 RepID=UPI00403B21B2
MQGNELKSFVLEQLEEIKAQDIKVIEVSEKSALTDFMVICSGTSSRHVKSIAVLLIKEIKAKQIPIIGVEGEDVAEWVLVDVGDVIVHIMLPTTRDYYQLEKLWEQ